MATLPPPMTAHFLPMRGFLPEMGVHFQCGVEIGKDLTIDQLREQGYKGFYLAIGAQKSAPIGVPGEDLSGVYGGVDFLRRVNLGKKPRIGTRVSMPPGTSFLSNTVTFS